MNNHPATTDRWDGVQAQRNENGNVFWVYFDV